MHDYSDILTLQDVVLMTVIARMNVIFYCKIGLFRYKIEQAHEISNNVLCATSKASDQPAHTCSLIRAFAIRLSIL